MSKRGSCDKSFKAWNTTQQATTPASLSTKQVSKRWRMRARKRARRWVMNSLLKIQKTLRFVPKARGRKARCESAPAAPPETGRVPRVARLMALAIRLDGLVQAGDV